MMPLIASLHWRLGQGPVNPTAPVLDRRLIIVFGNGPSGVLTSQPFSPPHF